MRVQQKVLIAGTGEARADIILALLAVESATIFIFLSALCRFLAAARRHIKGGSYGAVAETARRKLIADHVGVRGQACLGGGALKAFQLAQVEVLSSRIITGKGVAFFVQCGGVGGETECKAGGNELLWIHWFPGVSLK